MGVLDMAKMVRKAQQARKKMSQIQGVGQSGSVGTVVDGLYNVLEVEIDNLKLKQNLASYNISEKDIENLKRSLEKDIMESFKDAKKHLEKQLSETTSLDDLKGFLN